MSRLRRENRLLFVVLAFLFVAGFSPISVGVAATQPSLVTCVNVTSHVERISSSGKCIDFKEAPVLWRSNQSDSALPSVDEYKTITVCSNGKNSSFKYRVIRSKCGKYQETSSYIRTVAKPAQPIVESTLVDSDNEVSLTLANNPSVNRDSPVAFYTITLSDGSTRKVSSRNELSLAIKGLQAQTNYSFSVSATSADGTSKVSVATAPIRTPSKAKPAPTPEISISTNSVAAPSISLTSISETASVNSAATGFTVSSFGGTVDSYSLSPSAPAGMSFNTTTGAFTGTPTSGASATTYTVTATNTAGSTTATFVFTVVVPDTVISVAAIGGVIAPVTGATPVTSVTAAHGYTGVVTWSGSPTTFASSTSYTATITLTPASGYTLTGLTANFFTVLNASSVTHSANSGVITAVFPATSTPPAISLSAIAETATTNIAAVGFTINSTGGAVASYSISPSAPAGMTFNTSTGALAGTPTTIASATTYTVTATNGSGTATATFTLTVIAPPPATVISVAAIGGVTAPVTGATPVTSVTAANGYTGTVTWSGSPSTFAPTTTYTATITLTAASGYTLTGVTANFFTVSGASSVTHSADSGVVTAVFPATAVGPAAKAMMTTQPSGAINSTVFTTQPVVRVTDASGNTITSYTGSVVASIFPATGTLNGTKTLSAVAGVATFTNLYITTAGSYSLLFTPTSLTPVRSETFTVASFGTATKVGFSRSPGPGVITSGTTFTTQPQVAIRDASNNTVTTSTAVVTASISAGGTLIGVETVAATSGVATFSGQGITGTPGSTYTITYTVAGLDTVTASAYLSRVCDGSTFTCVTGDIGPGGGKIFYYSAVAFACGPTRASLCHYLEAAPKGWNTERAGQDPIRAWAQGAPTNYTTTAVGSTGATETATATAIGWGAFNTRAIVLQGNNNASTSAAALADAYSVTVGGTVFDDWYLPSYNEDISMITSGQILGLVAGTYWSSTESTFDRALNYAVSASWIGAPGSNAKNNGAPSLRPIRSF